MQPMEFRSAGEQLDWPVWVPRVFGVGGIVMACLAPFVQEGTVASAGLGLMVLGMLAPWLVVLVWPGAPERLIAACSLAVLTVVNVGGEPLGIVDLGHGLQLSLMLVVLTVTYVAGCERWAVPIGATVWAFAIILGRKLVAPEFDATWVWGIGTLLGLAGGRLVWFQQRMLMEFQAAQQARAEQAALDERRRVAREVHDVIAHSLSVTMLHLTAARLALQRNPQGAAEALAEAERLGRQSLNDVRRTVGLLRGRDDADGRIALPGIAELEDLVAEYRAAGLPVRLAVEGPAETLGPTAGLAVYRIVQESLTNVVKHAAGASATVSLDLGPGGTVLQIRDSGGLPAAAVVGDRGPDPGGLGLEGMRERVALLEGEFRAGRDGSGWLVECRLPVSALTVGESVR